jgi:membrane protein YdbS with pleckstrin-like domain
LTGIAETLRYRNERWALGDDQVAFVGGALATTLVVIPRVRAQSALISANWFQQRLAPHADQARSKTTAM